MSGPGKCWRMFWDAHADIFPALDRDLSNVVDWAVSSVEYVSLKIGFGVMNWQDYVATLSAYRRVLALMIKKDWAGPRIKPVFGGDTDPDRVVAFWL